MKNHLLLAFLLGVVYNLHSQDKYATTSDGKKVLLRNNGTWEYVNDLTGKKTTQQSTPKTLKSQNSTPKSSASTSRTYFRGPRGGCYYINRNGGKTYVDRSMCN